MIEQNAPSQETEQNIEERIDEIEVLIAQSEATIDFYLNKIDEATKKAFASEIHTGPYWKMLTDEVKSANKEGLSVYKRENAEIRKLKKELKSLQFPEGRKKHN